MKVSKLIKEFVLEVGLFGIMTASICMFWDHNILFVVLHIMTLIVFTSKLSESELIMFIIAFLFFPIGEIIIMSSGAWIYYVNPNFLGIPMWLPFSWRFLVILICRMGGTVEKLISSVKFSEDGSNI